MGDATSECMFRDHAVTLFRVRGVPIRAHWTLLLIIPYLAITLAYQFTAMASLAGVEHARLTLPPLVWGGLLAVGLFASVAIHELAHTLLAVRFGGRVRSITLMLVGGVSQMSRAPTRPLHEAVMAAAGPVASFVLALACGAGYALTAGSADLQMALFYLAAMNFSLGVFNLLPAFPMDGGRVLRAALAARLGRQRATTIAATIGKICAVCFVVLAIWSANLLLGLVALFVYAGASGEAAADRVRAGLGELSAADLLPARQAPPIVSAGDSVGAALTRMRELDRVELVVVDRGGEPLAVVEADDVLRLATGQRDLRLGEVASRLTARFVIASPTTGARDALEAAAERGASYVVVVDPASGAVIGLVGPQDVARAIKLHASSHPLSDAHPMAS